MIDLLMSSTKLAALSALSVAGWALLILLFIKSLREPKSKKRRMSDTIIFIILMLLIFVLLAAAINYVGKKKSRMAISYPHRMTMVENTDKASVGLRGTVFRDVRVYLNDKHVEDIDLSSGDLDYDLGRAGLSDGWNYLEFRSKLYFSSVTLKSGIFINKLKNKPSVIMPVKYVVKARMAGNVSFHKDIDYKNKYFKNDYIWYSTYPESSLLKPNQRIRFDSANIPMVRYGSGYKYNPVTVIHQAYGMHKKYADDPTAANKRDFISIVDWIANYQSDDGSLRYNVEYSIKPGVKLESGFVSAMAQGQALSLYARAYHLTKDIKYLDVGHKALLFMVSSAKENVKNGTAIDLNKFCDSYPSLRKYDNYTIFEEFLSDPPSYILNGALFGLLGLYDWSQASDAAHGKNIAADALNKGMRSIEVLLPYYDGYGWSAYDLMQYYYNTDPRFTSSYAHNFHIILLDALGKVKDSNVFLRYRDIFYDYDKDPFWRQRDIMYKKS